jgi:hypothetical protein
MRASTFGWIPTTSGTRPWHQVERCLKDIIGWSQGFDSGPTRRWAGDGSLLALTPHLPVPTDGHGADPASGKIEQVKCRTLRRAGQLSDIYLEEADSADDQSSTELAQELAAQSIMRLAGLRDIASASAPS